MAGNTKRKINQSFCSLLMTNWDGAMWDLLQTSPLLGSVCCSVVSLVGCSSMWPLGERPGRPSRTQAAFWWSTYPAKGRLPGRMESWLKLNETNSRDLRTGIWEMPPNRNKAKRLYLLCAHNTASLGREKSQAYCKQPVFSLGDKSMYKTQLSTKHLR